jgi:hypothetical protein
MTMEYYAGIDVSDWQFCYYNRENRNIFGEAMRGC